MAAVVEPVRAALVTPDQDELEAGMARLFVQLAPERLQLLREAATRLDVVSLQAQAHKLATAAESVDAHQTAHCARELALHATTQDYPLLEEHMEKLRREILRLDVELRSRVLAPVAN